MSKFRAKVKLKKDENTECLLKAFFKNFDPEGTIEIRGKEAEIELKSRKPSQTIIEAITQCKIVELSYGKFSEQAEQGHAEEELSGQAEQGNAEEELSRQAEQGHAEEENSGRRKVTRVELNPVDVPKLEELAKRAASFEHFVHLVAEWLEMGKRQELFEKMVIASTEVEQFSWKEIENALKRKAASCKPSDKIWISQQISGKLREYSITMMPFLKTVGEYKEYSFEQVKENSGKGNCIEPIEEFNDRGIPRPRVKMECMPEIDWFEEKLASVDMTQPIEARVHYVLESMGLNEKSPEEQRKIEAIANAAIKKENITMDIISVSAKLPLEKILNARLTFSKFIDDFVKKYGNGEKVKLLTFLSELQKIIVFDDEIERNLEFTE